MRRWLLRLGKLLAALLVLLLLVAGYARFFCIAEPPPMPEDPAILSAPPPRTMPDGTVQFGPAWYRAEEGLHRLYLEGDAFTRGYCHARLTGPLLEELEDDLFRSARENLTPLGFYTAYFLVLLNNRSLPDYVPAEYQLEILGMAKAGRDRYGAYAPLYHRVLNYHAAHDIAHWVWDKPVVGCTAFASAGAASGGDGHLWVGRNFDFEAGDSFERNRLVLCCRPDRGHAFVSVAWPGLSGAVTGINEHRLFCSVNGAHSSDRGRIGTPVSIVVRGVLQYCATLEEAVGRIREARVFVTDSYLVADGKTGQAVVVEKTPEHCAVRRAEGGVLLLANHFESDELAGDEGNRAYLAVGTSRQRRARLAELVREYRGRIDAEAVASILRDRCAPGGAPLALGNRGAIDACIATHSVVADVTRGTIWVSCGPHALGRYEAFRVDRFGEEVAPPIAASPAKRDGRYARLTEVRALLALAEETDEPLAPLEKAARLAPDDPDVLLRLADALADAGREAEARRRYREALDARPAFPGDRRRIEEILAD